jgi:hypothetical protein
MLLGVRHRRWRYTHTAGVLLGIVAVVAARLKDKVRRGARRQMTVAHRHGACRALMGIAIMNPGGCGLTQRPPVITGARPGQWYQLG